MRIFHTLVPSKVGEMNQPSHWHVHRVKKMGSITASSFWRSFTERGKIFEGNAQTHWKYIIHCMGQYIEPRNVWNLTTLEIAETTEFLFQPPFAGVRL